MEGKDAIALAEPLIHFTVSLAFMVMIGFGFRKSALFSFLALVPDIDALFHVHRSMSHSAVIAASMLAIPLIVSFAKKDGRLQRWIILAAFAVGSHLLLDVFYGYTPILWPLYDKSIAVAATSNVHIGSTPAIDYGFRILTKPTTFETFPYLDTPIFTTSGLGISLVLLIAPILKYLRRRDRTADLEENL